MVKARLTVASIILWSIAPSQPIWSLNMCFMHPRKSPLAKYFLCISLFWLNSKDPLKVMSKSLNFVLHSLTQIIDITWKVFTEFPTAWPPPMKPRTPPSQNFLFLMLRVLSFFLLLIFKQQCFQKYIFFFYKKVYKYNSFKTGLLPLAWTVWYSTPCPVQHCTPVTA